MSVNYRLFRASPEAVFRVLADGWLYPAWVVGASRIRSVEEVWPAPGSKIHHSIGVWPVLVDDSTSVLEWNPPRHAQFLARGWPIGEAHITLDVKPRRAGCVVRITEEAVSGPGVLVWKPLMDIGLLARNAETLERLAYLAEGGAGR